jgi:hypothetical protein
MEMEVWNRHAGVAPDIHDDAVSRDRDALLIGNPLRGLDEISEQLVVRLERVDVLDVASWHHENVDGRLRVHVAERDHGVGFEDAVRRDVAGRDGAEQAVGHQAG